jgi:hypothetical protein
MAQDRRLRREKQRQSLIDQPRGQTQVRPQLVNAAPPQETTDADQGKERRIPIGETAWPESAALQHGAQASLIVTPKVVQSRVVPREEPLMSRDADDGDTAGPQDSCNFANRSTIVLDVLEDIGGYYGIEYAVPKR